MKFEGPSSFRTDARTNERETRSSSAAAPWFKRIPPMFAILVVAPTLIATIYYLFIAAPMFVSETQFIVREKSSGSQSMPGAGGLLASFGLGGASQDDDQAVLGYLTSRDAVADLERNHSLRAMLERPGADFVARFPRPFESQTGEDLYKAFKRFLVAGISPQTGITTLRVTAFRAEDAHELTSALLADAEAMVNRMNERSLTDTVGQAERQLADAETAAANAQTALTEFRNHERIVDPALSTTADVELMATLEAQLANLKAERAGLAASAPSSPQLPVQDRNIAAYQTQIDAERARTAGQADSLAPKLGIYQRLQVDQEIAAKSLEAAEATLESSRLEAMRKQLYLEPLVIPNLPDKSEQPRRLRSIVTVLVSSLVAYAAISLTVAGLREHRQV